MFAAGFLAAALTWQWGLLEYQKERMRLLFDPSRDAQGIGYNVIQAQVAIGSGGLWGKGFGEGTQGGKRFLPEAATDFIFAAIAEEQGLFGISVLLTLFGVLWWRLMRLGARAAHNFGRIFIFGYAWLLTIEVFINAGMNVGLFPVVGLPLPFVSYGGSHLLSEFAGLGIVMAIAAQEIVKPTRHLVIE